MLRATGMATWSVVVSERDDEVDEPAVVVVEPADAADPSTPHSSDSCWTPKRRQLLAWLEKTAPHVAAVYAGAVPIAANPVYPGRVTFVWHAIREIRNRLPDALAGEVASSSVQYGALAEAICVCWIADGWPEDGTLTSSEAAEPSPSGPERFEVSRDMLAAVANLVSGHTAVAGRNQTNVKRLFEAVAGTAVPDYAIRTWTRSGRRAHKLAHLANKQVDPNYEQSLMSDFVAFETLLMAIANRSYENMDDLDAILGSANA
jgi:hypothetical protein